MTSIFQSRLDLNNQIARSNRANLTARGITAISLVGPAGSGKTSLIEALLPRVDPKLRAAAIIADLAAERQVERIARHGCLAVPIVTDNLAAIHVRDALSRLNLDKLDLLLIESEGNAHSPVEFDLGHHVRASVFSVAGCDDKATEYPFLIAGSDVVLITKIDLLPLVKFDPKVFTQNIFRVKPKLPMIHTSVQSNRGIEPWVDWVLSHLPSHAGDRSLPRISDPFVKIPHS
jgi:hydrogenase nickel incorporation protein HypB